MVRLKLSIVVRLLYISHKKLELILSFANIPIIMEKKPDVYEPKALHYALVFPLYVFVILLTATLRFKYSDKTKQRCTNPSRLLGVAWHRHILLVAKAKMYFRKKLTMSMQPWNWLDLAV